MRIQRREVQRVLKSGLRRNRLKIGKRKLERELEEKVE